MTLDRDLDLLLPKWFDERAVSSPPTDLLARSLAKIEIVRQRPAWLTQPGLFAQPRTIGPTLVPTWVVVAILLVVSVAVVAVGASLLKTQVVPVLPAPTTASSDARTAAPAQTPVATTAGLLGGGPILAHTFTRFGDPGPFDVVAIDAGAGATTLLGTLPGSSVTDSSLPYTFMRNSDLTRVIAPLANATAAARAFGFTPAPEIARELDWMALSPIGDRFAAIRADGSNKQFEMPLEIVILDLSGTVVAHLPIPTGMLWVGPLAWAHDDTAVLLTGCRPCNNAQTPTEKQTAHHAHLYIVPNDGTPWTELLDLDNGQLTGQVSPDGSRLAVERYVCAKGSVMPRCDPMEATASLSVLNLATGAETPLGDTPGITGVDWSPDGTQIAYGSREGAFVLDAATGAKVTLAAGQSFGTDWSPDGHWLLVSRAGQGGFKSFDVWIVRADGTELHRLLAGYAGATW